MACLEVTESVLIEDPESSIRMLTDLKELGIKIAIDDFGTGYSSLEYLRRLPVDCVKVDRSFVRGVPENEEDVAIVNAVIELGHALRLSVTAEGVETTDQLGNLQSAGCDTAQGFLFFRPEPPEVVEQLFAHAQAVVASRDASRRRAPIAPPARSAPQRPSRTPRPAAPADPAARRPRQPPAAGAGTRSSPESRP